MLLVMSLFLTVKVEYHADTEYENPLQNSDKNSMCW